MDISNYVSGVTQNITNKLEPKSISATTVGNALTDLALLTKDAIEAKFDSTGATNLQSQISTVSTQVATISNSPGIADVLDLQPNALYIADNSGNAIFRANASGITYINQITDADIDNLQTQVNAISGATVNADILNLNNKGFYITDNDGYIAFQVSSAGTVNYNGIITANTSTSAAPLQGNYQADINHYITYGQSLAVGGSFTTAIDFYDAQTFKGGVLTDYEADDLTAKTAYYGTGLVKLPATGVETQVKGVARIVKDLIRDENGIAIANQQYTFVVNAPGRGGYSWAQLIDTGGTEYRRLIDSVRYAKDFAMSSGKTYNVNGLCYIQGERTSDRDDTEQQWFDKLSQMFTQLNTDIKAITGQANDLQFATYQIASGMQDESYLGVPLGQLRAAKEIPNVSFGCAMYQMEYADELGHVTSNSYRLMGAMIGVTLKRALIDGVKMKPILPNAWTVQKNEASTQWVINMKMDVPVKPLVLDSTWKTYVSGVTNSGFSIKTTGGTEIISAVTISRGDTLNIFCSQNPKGLELKYAVGGKDSGGYLRDSQGDKVTISCQGVTKRVDNWAPIFKQVI